MITEIQYAAMLILVMVAFLLFYLAIRKWRETVARNGAIGVSASRRKQPRGPQAH